VREDRNARLLAVINDIGARRYESRVGETMQVLVEGPSKRNPARQMGRSRCNKIVIFEDREDQRGRLMNVQIQRAGSFTLYGPLSPSSQ
jgi:tRNA-2-methylthio-N6-dimethylallyladenosine synthase